MTCCGGHTDNEVSQKVKDLVNGNIAGINSALGKNYTSFHVDKVWTQVVAGTNYTVHLTANDNSKVTVRLYEPLPHTNQPVQVSKAVDGHVDASSLTH
jgi:cystatin-A/B